MSDKTPPSITSRSEFVAALHWGFEQALAAQARRIVCVDADFANWPLDDTALHGVLTNFLKLPQRKLVLLATHYDAMPRLHPRFVAWRAAWSHAIDAWSPQEGEAPELPTLLLDDKALCVQLHDAVHWRGRAALDARDARLLRDEVDALLQRSEAAFPVTSLGL